MSHLTRPRAVRPVCSGSGPQDGAKAAAVGLTIWAGTVTTVVTLPTQTELDRLLAALFRLCVTTYVVDDMCGDTERGRAAAPRRTRPRPRPRPPSRALPS